MLDELKDLTKKDDEKLNATFNEIATKFNTTPDNANKFLAKQLEGFAIIFQERRKNESKRTRFDRF